MAETVSRKQAIKEVMRQHGLTRTAATALVDELIKVTAQHLVRDSEPIGLRNAPRREIKRWQN